MAIKSWQYFRDLLVNGAIPVGQDYTDLVDTIEDSTNGNFLPISGGEMKGSIDLNGNNLDNIINVRGNSYRVNDSGTDYFRITTSVFTNLGVGNLEFINVDQGNAYEKSYYLSGTGTPEHDRDLTTKEYVDSKTVTESQVLLEKEYSNIKKISSEFVNVGTLYVEHYGDGYTYAYNYDSDLDPNSKLFDVQVGDVVYVTGLDGEIASLTITDYVYSDAGLLEFEFGSLDFNDFLDSSGNPVSDTNTNFFDVTGSTKFDILMNVATESVAENVADALSYVNENLIPYTASNGVALVNKDFKLGGTITEDVDFVLDRSGINTSILDSSGERIYHKQLSSSGSENLFINNEQLKIYANFNKSLGAKSSSFINNASGNSSSRSLAISSLSESFGKAGNVTYSRQVANNGATGKEVHTYYTNGGDYEGETSIHKAQGSIFTFVKTPSGSTSINQNSNTYSVLSSNDNTNGGFNFVLSGAGVGLGNFHPLGGGFLNMGTTESTLYFEKTGGNERTTLKIQDELITVTSGINQITDPKSVTTKEYVEYELSKPKTISLAPTSSSDTGTKGEIRYTSTGLYICIDTDYWVDAMGNTF